MSAGLTAPLSQARGPHAGDCGSRGGSQLQARTQAEGPRGQDPQATLPGMSLLPGVGEWVLLRGQGTLHSADPSHTLTAPSEPISAPPLSPTLPNLHGEHGPHGPVGESRKSPRESEARVEASWRSPRRGPSQGHRSSRRILDGCHP